MTYEEVLEKLGEELKCTVMDVLLLTKGGQPIHCDMCNEVHSVVDLLVAEDENGCYRTLCADRVECKKRKDARDKAHEADQKRMKEKIGEIFVSLS